jgi:uncharacterized protein (TIGR00106 family)
MLAQLTVLPMGKGEGISKYVSQALEEIDKSGLDYRLTSMGTIIEGEWDEVMKTIKRVRERLLKKSNRIYLIINVDDRKSKQKRLQYKVAAVERLLGKKLS